MEEQDMIVVDPPQYAEVWCDRDDPEARYAVRFPREWKYTKHKVELHREADSQLPLSTPRRMVLSLFGEEGHAVFQDWETQASARLQLRPSGGE